jgi:SAM-dependent methyltransferase
LFDVVEHLKSPIKVLREISRIPASGGIIYLTTPNPRGLGRSFLSRFSQKWKDKDATHININPAGFWLNVLQENNFRILEAKFLIENLLGRFDVAFPLFGGTTHIIAVKLRDKRRSSRLEDIPCCR